MGSSRGRSGDLRQVVCDTGPILHLHEVGALDLLQRVGEITIPPVVAEELERLVPNSRPLWIAVRDLVKNPVGWRDWVEAGVLDPGEAQALGLVLEIGATWFLTDDTAARLVASRLKIEVHGSLGVVLWAVATKHLSGEDAAAVLEALFLSSLWISPRVQSEARRALVRILGRS